MSSQLEEQLRDFVREVVRQELAQPAPASLADPTKLAYTYKEATKATGFSRSTLHLKVKSGHLKATRVGRHVVFTTDALRELLGEQDVARRRRRLR